MAEHSSNQTANSSAHDGRFGDRFDDEIRTRGVLLTTAILGGLCVLAMLLMWGMKRWVEAGIRAESPAISPLIDLSVGQRPIGERQPKGVPNLQPNPRADLEQMRREQAKELHGYGWIDEGAGIVRVPIEVAIDRVLAAGLPSRPAPPPAAEPTGEERTQQ